MTIYTDGLRERRDIGVDELQASLGESLGATVGESIDALPSVSIFRMHELATASGSANLAAMADTPFVSIEGARANPADVADVPIEEARQRVKDAGLDKTLHLPTQTAMKAPALDIMIDRARERREREATISRGPSGFVPGALSIGTSFLVSAVDPLNVASAFIPVMGEARFAKLMASAGEGALARAGTRASVGAASGAVGMAALEPLQWSARRQEGQDYTFGDALRSVMYGSLLGGVLHSGGGAVADLLRVRRGQPLYPFAEGEPFARPAAAQPASGVRQIDLGGVGRSATEETPLSGLPIEKPALPAPAVPAKAAGEVTPPAQPAAKPQSLIEFIKARGGVDPNDPLAADLIQSFGGKPPRGLIREGGQSLDRHREAAVEAGYLEDPAAQHGGVTESTINDLLDAADTEARGTKIYPAGEVAPVDAKAAAAHSEEQRQHFIDQANADFDAVLDARGVDKKRANVKARALTSMLKEGVEDPAEAIDRALRHFRLADEHPAPAPIEAWHGSPHDFERFDVGRIGGGEGSQSFGHGLYFAENPKVAGRYKKTTSVQDFIRRVREIYDQDFTPSEAEAAIRESKDFTPAQRELIDAVREDDWLGFDYPHQAVSAALNDPRGLNFELSDRTKRAVAAVGNVYKVRIHANREHFLDWDKPLSEQSAYVKAALGDAWRPDQTGESIASNFGIAEARRRGLPVVDAQRAAAEGLLARGIQGIKYLDQGSRGTKYWVLRHPQGGTVEYPEEALARSYLAKNPEYKLEPPDITRNFVLFSDRDVEIIEKNGNAVLHALEDLPPAMREDALRVSIAALHEGKPVQAGELLAAAARDNPRMAALSAEARQWPDLPEQAHFAGNGDNGPIIDGLQDRWGEAIAWLRQAQSGDAIGVLEHPQVPGRIDLIWGDREHGLAHIDAKHPGDADALPALWGELRVVRADDKFIELQSDKATAVIARDFAGDPKDWLLTFFQRREGGARLPEGPSPAPEIVRQAGQSPASPRTENIGRDSADVEGAWRDLSQAKNDVDEPASIDASRAADRAPEPASLSPEPSARVAAAEKAAAEAEAEYKAQEAYLPDDLKVLVERDLAALDIEAKDRAHVIERGAACLAAAVGVVA